MATLTEWVHIRTDPPLQRVIDELCAREHRTRSNLVRFLILRAANGLPEVVTSQELRERMDREAVRL